jgi:hypothetical protein
MPLLSRRDFRLSASALCALPAFAAADDRGILITSARAEKLRSGAALKAGPWSVTCHRPGHVSLGPNHYYSVDAWLS